MTTHADPRTRADQQPSRGGFLAGLCLLLMAGLLSADEPKTAAEAKTLVEKGGTHWSAPKTAKAGKETINPGTRFYVWPIEDKVHESRRGARSVIVKFGWRLQDGQKAPVKKEFVVSFMRPVPDDGTMRIEQALLKSGQESGTFDASFPIDKLKAGQEREALFHLSLNRKPVSNLVRLELKAGK